MFCLSKEDRILADCSNFAPLLGIPEESATGTSNASLAYYLHEYGVIEENKEYLVIQGEHMGRRSEIRTRVVRNNNGIKIQVGGNAVILMECVLRI
jgi:PhzF family phenazine biosynthesis protein